MLSSKIFLFNLPLEPYNFKVFTALQHIPKLYFSNSNNYQNIISVLCWKNKLFKTSSIENKIQDFYYTKYKYKFGNYKKSIEVPNLKNKNKDHFYRYIFFLMLSSGFFFNIMYQSNKNKIDNIMNFTFKEIKTKYSFIKSIFELPFNKFLLLDKLETVNDSEEKSLILNLDKTLLCYKYSLFGGFKIIQRPGLKYFLNELSDYYEIIIFSNEDLSLLDYISSIIYKNKDRIIYRLGNEGIKFLNGKPTKDLNYLNRNINEIIAIDYDLKNIPEQTSNTIILPEYKGDGKDRELLFIIPFLKEISYDNKNNVQRYLRKYGNFKPYINYYKENPKYNNMLPKI